MSYQKLVRYKIDGFYGIKITRIYTFQNLVRLKMSDCMRLNLDGGPGCLTSAQSPTDSFGLSTREKFAGLGNSEIYSSRNLAKIEKFM